MRALLISLILSISLSFSQGVDIKKLKADPVLIQYKKVSNELMTGLREKRYKLPSNYLELMKQPDATPNKAILKKRLRDGGMKNADEFVDKSTLQGKLIVTFMKKHPELSKMDGKARGELMIKLLKS